MHLDQVVNVHCTDTDKQNKGRVVRMHPKGIDVCLLYTSPSPRDPKSSRMPSSA